MDDRERALTNARRLRRGVVATGVVGSLGVAAFVGLPALQQAAGTSATTASSTPAQQAPTSHEVQRQTVTRGDDGGERGGDDGWTFTGGTGATGATSQTPQQQWNPPSTGFSAPAPGNGGASHAGTMGS